MPSLLASASAAASRSSSGKGCRVPRSISRGRGSCGRWRGQDDCRAGASITRPTRPGPARLPEGAATAHRSYCAQLRRSSPSRLSEAGGEGGGAAASFSSSVNGGGMLGARWGSGVPGGYFRSSSRDVATDLTPRPSILNYPFTRIDQTAPNSRATLDCLKRVCRGPSLIDAASSRSTRCVAARQCVVSSD